MAIKVLFSPNQNTITVGGLYQWDYGRVLEIECAEFGSEIMEIHFACRGMEEAIVRPCTFSSGIGTVTIPDRCLEQTKDITAWIYKVESTQGHTVKTITLPVVSRTRPSKSQDVPTEYINQYAELIEEINEAVDALEEGNIIAAEATHAVSADNATTADSAANATHATYATRADRASGTDYVRVAIQAPNKTVDIVKNHATDNGQKDFESGFYFVTFTIEGYESNYEFDYDTIYSGMGYIGANTGKRNTYYIPLGSLYLVYTQDEQFEFGKSATTYGVYSHKDDSSTERSGKLKFYHISSLIYG